MSEKAIVEFRPDENRDLVVRLSFKRDGADGFGRFEIEAQAEGLRCTHGALSLGGDGLDRFLADLAADWKGWDGIRRWDALELGMSIEATHQGKPCRAGLHRPA